MHGVSSPPVRARVVFAAAALAVSAALLTSCAAPAPSSAYDRLRPCRGADAPTDAYCGTLTVPEDRRTSGGRRIALNIVVLPSTSLEPQPDPLFFLAGGPGQGAAQMARPVQKLFRRVLRTRDIVLVDQRGTGRSNPLNCTSPTDTLAALTEPDAVGLARLKRCLDAYDADVRFYTTPIAMDDLDAVRSHLGYERVNLYGGSYGTRAALVYLRKYGDRVRSMVLDGVAPMDMRLPLFTARDAQRALDTLLGDCEADASCRAAFPGLPSRVRGLLQRLEVAPPRARLRHPRTGIEEDVQVEARLVASVIFGALYSPLTASIVPMLVDRAERNDFESLFALGLANEASAENMSTGMMLSVICSEDAGRFTQEDIEREAAPTVFRTYLLSGQVQACETWPRGAVDASYYEPVTSDVPALVLSGELDPVTPPSWGGAVVRHLRNARHVIMPATGHGVVGTACGASLVATFIERGSAGALDTSCVKNVRRPPFFISPAGPDPAPRAGAAAP